MKNLFARFLKDESGATAIEYGLLAALIATAVIVGAGAFGDSIEQAFTDLGDNLETEVNNMEGSGS